MAAGPEHARRVWRRDSFRLECGAAGRTCQWGLANRFRNCASEPRVGCVAQAQSSRRRRVHIWPLESMARQPRSERLTPTAPHVSHISVQLSACTQCQGVRRQATANPPARADARGLRARPALFRRPAQPRASKRRRASRRASCPGVDVQAALVSVSSRRLVRARSNRRELIHKIGRLDFGEKLDNARGKLHGSLATSYN